jgi:peptide/nickel transport system substrate-binding protein
MKQGYDQAIRRMNGRFSRRSGIRAALAGTSVAALAVACGRSGSSTSTSTTSGASGGQPKNGGTANIIETNDFFDFDPTYQGSSLPNGDATMISYDTLLDFDRDPGLDWAVVSFKPRLASKWETPDAQTYTFHLQPNIKFQNLAPVNGRSFTSADVKWTLDYLSRTGQFGNSKLPTPPYASTLAGLQSVETPDPSTVVVHFDAPYAPFLNYLVSFSMPMIPHEIYDQDGNLKDRMAGTGAFTLDSNASQKGSQWVFNKNPNYWLQGKPHVDKIRYLVVNDLPSQRSAFQAKQLDLVWIDSDPTAANALKQTMPSAQVKQVIQPSPVVVMLNMRHDIFKDLRVRQAISLAVDRDEFNNVVSGGASGWPMVAAFGLWTQDEIKQIPMMKTDIAQAKQLLAAAGYANGLSFPLLDDSSMDQKPFQLLQSQLKKAGINVTLDLVDKATRSQKTNVNDFTATLLAEKDFADPDFWLYANNHSAGGSNRDGVNDPKMDDLIMAQRRETDANKRNALVKQASRYIIDNAYYVAAYTGARWYFTQPWLHNYTPQWVAYDWNSRDIWVDRQ